jgi:hypothetical protein
MALIGAILFLVSGFLPFFVTSGARGIVYEYQYVGSEDWSGGFASDPVGTLGFLLLVILWPVALVLGIVSILKRKIALVAGIFGIICWASGAMYVIDYQMQLGAGVYVGFVAAALLLVAYYLKPKQAAPSTSPQPFAPPPPPP